MNLELTNEIFARILSSVSIQNPGLVLKIAPIKTTRRLSRQAAHHPLILPFGQN